MTVSPVRGSSGLAGIATSVLGVGALLAILAVQEPVAAALGGRGLYLGSVSLKACIVWLACGLALIAWLSALVRRDVEPRTSLPLRFVALWAVWGVLATIVGDSPYASVFGFRWRLEGLLSLLAYAAAFAVVVQACDRASCVRRVLTILVVAASVSAAYGVLQSAGLDPLPWPAVSWGARRAFSTIGNPDTFGSFCVLAAFAAAGLAASEEQRRRRIAYWAASGLCVSGAVLSFSRAAWVGLVVATLASLVIRPWRWAVASRRAVLAAAAVVLVALAVTGLAMRGSSTPDSDVVRRISSALDVRDRNTAERLIMWRTGVEGVAASPLTGHGPDSFVFVFEPRKPEEHSRIVGEGIIQDSAHNVFVQVASDLGLIGLGLWVAAVASVLAGAWRRARGQQEERPGFAAMTSMLLAGVLGFLSALQFVPTVPAIMLPFWIVLGALAAPAARPASRPRRASTLAAWAGMALCGVAVAVAGLFIAADAAAAVASDAALPSDRRIEAADRATKLMPVYAEFRAVAARAIADTLIQARNTGTMRLDVAAGLRDSMVAHAQRMVELEPLDPQRRVLLASMLLLGDSVDGATLDDAAREIAEARRLSPNDLQARYWEARILLAQEERSGAEKTLRAALAVRPGYVKAALLLSEMLAQDGRTAEARAVLEAAMRESDDPALVQALAGLGSPSSE